MSEQILRIGEDSLDNNKGGGGLSISVPGFKRNPQSPDDGQIFIEVYEGKLRVHVWTGKEDPETIEVERED